MFLGVLCWHACIAEAVTCNGSMWMMLSGKVYQALSL